MLVEEHYPNLRARFVEVDGQLHKSWSPLSQSLLSQQELVAPCTEPSDWTVIDHKDGPLFRLTLTRAKGSSTLWIAISHLVFDGAVYPAFCQLLEALTDTRRLARRKCPSPRTNTRIAAPGQEAYKFWQAHVAGRQLAVALPFIERPLLCKTRQPLTQRVMVELSCEERSQLLLSAETHQVSPFQWALACTLLVSASYLRAAGEPAGIVISHTVSLAEPDSTLGCYTNVLPCLVDDDPDQSVTELMGRIKRWRRLSRPHQGVPGTEIAAMAEPLNDALLRPFNIMVTTAEGALPIMTPKLQGRSSRLVAELAGASDADLTIALNGNRARFRLMFECPAMGPGQSRITDFAQHWRAAVMWIGRNPTQPLRAFSITRTPTPVCVGNPSTAAAPHPFNSVMHHAQQTPEKTAVCTTDGQLSYRQLWDASLTLAQQLRTHEVQDRPVALHIGRSIYLPVALLGCLAAGIPFTPLACDTLPERVDEQIINLDCKLVICHDKHRVALQIRHPNATLIPIESMAVSAQPRQWAVHVADKDPLHAYWITTSGSSGKPKTVMVRQDSLFNLLASLQQFPGLHSMDRLLAIAPISFDIALMEILLPLMVGAYLEIAPDDARRDGAALGQLIDRSQATVVQATPSTWLTLQATQWRALKPLRLWVGGEPLTTQCAAYLLEQNHSVYNVYGPTEATIWASACRITSADVIPLGRPVQNTQLYVLDDELRSLPAGMPGELVIAGDALADGYLDGAGSGFIEATTAHPRFYRTGDRVRHDGNGQVFFIGRSDTQIKILGQRTDLSEIEHALQDYASLAQWAVNLEPLPAPHLCAYYTIATEWQPDLTELTAHLYARLPAYAVPQRLVCLSQFPRTAHGKLARRELAQAVVLKHIGKPSTPVPLPATNDQGRDWPWLQAAISEALNIDVDDPALPFGWSGINSVALNRLSHQLRVNHQVVISAAEIISSSSPMGLLSRLGMDKTPYRAPMKPASRQVQTRQKIAIVAMHGEFPGSTDLTTFWQLQKERACSIATSGRSFLAEDFQAGFIEGLAGFDHGLFRISPREASQIDPRQRRLLHSTWRLLESAGYRPSQLAGSRTGCYIGGTGTDYPTLRLDQGASVTSHWLQGSSAAMLSNRLSYFFDWKGPSLTLDTACSSSFCALIRACHDLQDNRCDHAVVGACNLLLDQRANDALMLGGFLSPSFRSAPMSSAANGYVRGEATATVMLKRHADALRDGDPVLGLISAFGENHGGRTASLTAPSSDAQTALLLDIYTAELASRVSYLEPHGTGTQLGDTIECRALHQAWQSLGLQGARTIPLGTLKRNIGHSEAAAGLASLIRTLLSMEHQQLPGSVPIAGSTSLTELAPGFYVPDSGIDWPDRIDRVAGISSFGFGGHNSHIVVEHPGPAASIPDVESPGSRHLFVLSAHSPAALTTLRENVLEWLTHQPDEPGHRRAIAANLALCRDPMRYRQAWCASSLKQLRQQLRAPWVPTSDDAEVGSLEGLRQDYLAGRFVDWSYVFPHGRGRLLDLPPHPLSEHFHWHDNRNIL
ncbi:AMP-binding protein [Pseudomonas synxantha]